MSDLSGVICRTSTRSGGNGGDCVEVAVNLPDVVAVRDGKDRDGGTLTLTPAAGGTSSRACATVSSTAFVRSP